MRAEGVHDRGPLPCGHGFRPRRWLLHGTRYRGSLPASFSVPRSSPLLSVLYYRNRTPSLVLARFSPLGSAFPAVRYDVASHLCFFFPLACCVARVSSLVDARARSGWATRPSTFGILPKRSLISLRSLLPITQYVHLSSPSAHVRVVVVHTQLFVKQLSNGDGNSPIGRFCQSSTPTNSTCQATPTSTPRRRVFRSATKSSLSPVRRACSSPRTTRRRCRSTSVPPGTSSALET